jgi:hypothetical protein
VPAEDRPRSTLLSDCCGLYVPLNGAPPFWIRVTAFSSKVVLVKFARVPVPPMWVKS